MPFQFSTAAVVVAGTSSEYAVVLPRRFLKIYLELEEKDAAKRRTNFIAALEYMSKLPLKEVKIIVAVNTQ